MRKHYKIKVAFARVAGRGLAVMMVTVFLLAMTFVQDKKSTKLPERDDFHLFLLAGQSNMAGRGVLEPQDLEAHANVLTLDRSGEWVPAVDPIHFDKPIAGVGPGRSFGLAIAEHDSSVTIGLIPCAVGGSAITAWVPAGKDSATNTHPYDDALNRVRRALKDGVLKAILWHQGESDANPEAAPLYKERLRALVAKLRSDIGDSTLPFIAGQLGQFGRNDWNDVIDRSQRELAVEVPYMAFVNSDGLAHKGDSLHFSAEAARIFGKRYAHAYLKIRTAKTD